MDHEVFLRKFHKNPLTSKKILDKLLEQKKVLTSKKQTEKAFGLPLFSNNSQVPSMS